MPWPRFTWDATARQYRDSRGRFVPRADVREALDATIDRAAADIEAVARRLQVGEVEIGEWHAQTEGLLKLLHVASGAAAVGGWGQATPETWGLVGSRLKDQYRFLRDFAGQLANGLPLDGRFLARAGMYALSGTATYEAVLRRGDLAAGYDLEKRVLHPGKSEACSECVGYAALGWQPAGTMPDIGQGSRCLTRCRCRFVRRRSGTRLPRISPITGAIVTAFAAPEVDFDDAGLVAGPEVEFGDFEPAEPEPEPQPYRPPWWRRMVAFARKARLPRKAHAGLNSGCGTGAGGFKHGNTCGKRVGAHGTGRGGTQAQRKKLAQKIKALRKQARTPEQKKQLLAAIRTLKAHERGTGDAAQAAKIRRQIHAGKAPKVAVAPKQPTGRERIQAAVAAKRAQRGLSPEQRTKEAGLRRAVRKQQAEAKAKAERAKSRADIVRQVQAQRKQRGLDSPTVRKSRLAHLKFKRRIAAREKAKAERNQQIRRSVEARRAERGLTPEQRQREAQFRRAVLAKTRTQRESRLRARDEQAARAVEDLRTRVKSARKLSDKAQAAEDWVDRNRAGNPEPVQKHGMSATEAMDRVEYEGIRLHFPATAEGRRAAGFTLADWVDNKPLPGRLREATRGVYLSTQANRDDAFWEKQYKTVGFTSGATGGDGNVVSYHGSLAAHRLVHESGHNLATQLYGSTHPAASSDYRKAMDSGEPPPTAYAAKSPSEDFAESFREYWSHPAEFQKKAPRRFAVVDRLLKDQTYGG